MCFYLGDSIINICNSCIHITSSKVSSIRSLLSINTDTADTDFHTLDRDIVGSWGGQVDAFEFKSLASVIGVTTAQLVLKTAD